MAGKKDEKKDFVVKDRRIFAGENLDEAETEEKETPAAEEDHESDSPEASEAAAGQQSNWLYAGQERKQTCWPI